jgi:putative (di)nucleoside polyphosphate hydrolase
MLEKFEKLPLRSGVGIVVLNKDNKVFVAKRIDNPRNFWQMPQGGINEGENNLDAALRELEEETSIKSVKLIKEVDGYTTYLLPDNLLGIIWKGKFKGQKQKWFLMRFKGKDSDFNLNSHIAEFDEWAWRNLEEMPDLVVDFKKELYLKLIEKFSPIEDKIKNN